MTDRNVADGAQEDDGESYRFDPEDFDGDGGPTDSTPDRAPLVVGASVAIGGLLFLAGSLVDAPTVGGVEIRPIVLSAAVLAGGLLYGSVAYVGAGRRALGYAHAAGGAGWLLVLLGTALSNATAIVAGVAVLLVGAAALAALVLDAE